MIVRVYEEGEMSWFGDLEDLLEANHFLTRADRKRLTGLEPGETVELDSGFLVKRPEAVNVPVIPGLPRTGLSTTQVGLYTRAHKVLTEAKAHAGFVLQRRRIPTPKEERDAAEALSVAANELIDIECQLANARHEAEGLT